MSASVSENAPLESKINILIMEKISQSAVDAFREQGYNVVEQVGGRA